MEQLLKTLAWIELIAQFQNETRIWGKQAEVHLLQLLGILVAVPILVFIWTSLGHRKMLKQGSEKFCFI